MTLICAILTGGAASVSAASEHVARSASCPYAASYTQEGELVKAVFVLPAEKESWIHVEDQPELLGLEWVEVVTSKEVNTESPWSRGEVQPVLKVSPCGSKCEGCPQYRERCQGCPATVFYLEGV